MDVLKCPFFYEMMVIAQDVFLGKKSCLNIFLKSHYLIELKFGSSVSVPKS